jgi:hydrogenase small subunit
MSEQREWTRREFLELFGKGTGILMGASLFSIPGFSKVFAQSVAEVPVVWLQGGCCTGCSVSLLNSKSPTIQDLLLGEVVPGKHISLLWHPNVSASQGHQFIQIMDEVLKRPKGSYVLVAEGTVQTKDDGAFCEVGERDGKPVTMYQHLLQLAPNAMAIIAMGTCASFGGIPAAPPNPTGSRPVRDVLADHGIKTPVVNIPGCPPHPDWFVGTVATVLIGGLAMIDVDEHARPKAFYGRLIHDNCPRRGLFDQGIFAKDFSDKGCLYALGCKGPVTHSDCPIRKWNGGVNWIIGSGHPCMGCVEPTFPYGMNMYERVNINVATAPSTYPGIVTEKKSKIDPLVTGIVGAAAGIAVGAAAATAMGKKKQGVAEKEEA